MFVVIGVLTILSTVYDVYTKSLSIEANEAWKSFSLSKNFEELCKINRSPSIINCIDGIKALSAIWIILGHRTERFNKIYTNSVVEEIFWKSTNSFLDAVVTFLACSGVVATQSCMKAFDR